MPKVERRPDPPPLQTNNQRIALAGTALWTVALAVLVLFFRGRLAEAHRLWWLTTCAVGIVVGLYGIWYTRKR